MAAPKTPGIVTVPRTPAPSFSKKGGVITAPVGASNPDKEVPVHGIIEEKRGEL